jgi:hypothetical protein
METEQYRTDIEIGHRRCHLKITGEQNCASLTDVLGCILGACLFEESKFDFKWISKNKYFQVRRADICSPGPSNSDDVR